MARKTLINRDMDQNQILNLRLHVSAGDPATPVEGQVWYDTTPDRIVFRTASASLPVVTAAGDLANGSIANGKLTTDPLARANHTGTQTASTVSDLATVVKAYRLDEFANPTAARTMNGQKITGLAAGSASGEAVEYAQLNAAISGLEAGWDWKQAVRVATTAPGTLATSFENGDTVDGVVIATGDRILLKNQAAGAENGIRVVAASGAPTRATDADTAAEIKDMTVMVAEGTANAGGQWHLTTETITLDTTALVYAQVNAGSAYTAGNGLTLTGSDFNVGAGTGILANANDVAIDTTVVMRRYAVAFGDGAATSYTITHNLGTRDVTVAIYNATSYEEVDLDVTHTTTNTVTLTFATAPASNQYRCVVIG